MVSVRECHLAMERGSACGAYAEGGKMNATKVNIRIPGRVLAVGVPVLALVIGASAAALARDSAPTRVFGTAAEQSAPANLEPNHGSPSDQKTFDDFTVKFQAPETGANSDLIVYYQVSADGSGGFGEMLGIPRIVNPDGSIVLPSEYGSVGSEPGSVGGIPGVPAGSLGAVFDAKSVAPGAFARFGPLFRSSSDSLTIHATGAELEAGTDVLVGGESVRVSALANPDGTTSIQFRNQETSGSVVATHPGSRVSVEVDGKQVVEIHGSTNFAKTVGYDVNAYQSTIDIAGTISPGSVVSINSSSIGFIHRGEWDFPLD